MKCIIRIFLAVILTAFFSSVCSFSYAAPAFPSFIPEGQPVPSPQPLNAYSDKSVYYESAPGGGFVAKVGYPPSMSWMTGVADVTATSLSATTANPDGYVPKVNASGAAVLESSVDLKIAAPAGAIPSAGVSSSASTMAGGGASSGTLVKTVPLGSGAGSLASSIGKSALNIGAAGAAFISSPALLGTLTALSVGMAGYDFYQNLKGQGLNFNPDGSVTSSTAQSGCPPNASPSDTCTPITPVAYTLTIGAFSQTGAPDQVCMSACNYFYPSPQAYCAAKTSIASGANNSGLAYSDVTKLQWTCGLPLGQRGFTATTIPNTSFTYSDAVTGLQFSVNSAASPAALKNEQVQAAVDKASLDSHIAADLAALAIARSLPLPIPNGMSSLSSPAVTVKSAFSESSSSTDSLGNTTSVLQRNVANLSPASGGSNPVLDMRRETVTVVNSAPTSVTSTSLAPTIAGSVATAAAQAQQTKDLCVDHPDILACADISRVGDVPDEVMLKKDVNVSITPVVLPQNLVCPAGITHRSILGGVQYWDIWSEPCSFAPKMKPIVLSFAWLAAGMIVFVGRPYQ